MTLASACRTGQHRAARAGTVSAVAVGIGLLAHAAGGGCVRLGATAGALVVVGISSWVLARREVSGAAVLVWLASVQVFVHVVLRAACPGDQTSVAHPSLMLAGHVLAVLGSAAALRAGEAGVWTASRLRLGVRRVAARLALFNQGAEPLGDRTLLLPVTSVRAMACGPGPVRGGTGRRAPPARPVSA